MGRHNMGMASAPPAASGDAVLAVIRACWERTFPALPFDPALRWQESGADSLGSMHLMLRLEEALGRAIPFDLLTRDTTAAALAAALGGAGGDAGVAARPLVFLVPGLLGDEPRLADFRRSLGSAMRFHTLALPDIDRPAALLRDVPATARLLADDLEAAQPAGPVMIAGYSFGGILACEASLLLAERGRDIALLGLLDPFLRIRADRPLAVADRPAGARVAAGNPLRRRQGQGAADMIERLRFGAAFVTGRLDAARRHLLAVRGDLPPETLYWRRQRLIGRLRWQALKRWRPRANPAPALLVTSDEATRHYDVARWLALLPHAEHLPVGGDHLALFDATPLALIAPAFAARVAAATRG